MLLSVKNDSLRSREDTIEKQLILFLSSGAGLRKTTVTQCLYEALDNKPGENPDELKVLKLAPDKRRIFQVSHDA